MTTIHVFNVSSTHDNPAPFNLVNKQIVRAQVSGRRVVVLEEINSDITLEKRLADIRFLYTFSEDQINLRILINSKKNVLLSNSEKTNFINTCKNKKLFEDNFERYYSSLVNNKYPYEIFSSYQANYQKIELYKSLNKTGTPIPYFGIDLPHQERERFLDTFYQEAKNGKEKEVMAENEHKRLQHMANIYRKALDLLTPTGGIIFIINLGMIHSLRLAYYQQQALLSQPLSPRVNVQVMALRFFVESSQGLPINPLTDIAKKYDEVEKVYQIKNVDTSEMQAFYKRYPPINLFSQQGKDHNDFSCKDFDALIEKTVYSTTVTNRSNSQKALTSDCQLLFDVSKRFEPLVDLHSTFESDDLNVDHKPKGLLVPDLLPLKWTESQDREPSFK